jgi:glycosyltransferase involved in cell wall biosynthesis
VIFELSRVLSESNEVHVVCPRPVAPTTEPLGPNVEFRYAAARELFTYPIPEKFELNRMGLSLLAQMVFAVVSIFAAYAELHRSRRPDVTYITNKYIAVPILLTFRGRDRERFIYSEQNIWPWLYPAPRGGLARFRFLINVWLGKLSCWLSDRVHANSDSLREALLRHGLEGNRVVTIPNGVPIPPGGIEPTPLSEPLHVAFVGRLVEDKGVRTLVDAMAQANELHRPVHFVVFGDGPLRSLIADYRGDNCSFMGDRPREEVLSALQLVHAAVFLSPVENVPSLALLEALALGKAVVATRVGDTSRFLTDRQNAILCDPNSESVLRALALVSGDPELYRRLTSNAQALAAAHSWDAVAKKHVELCLSAMIDIGA